MKANRVAVIMMAVAVLSGCVMKSTNSLSPTRTISERVVDLGIERDARSHLPIVEGLVNHGHRVAIDAFRGEVLLTGEVPSEHAKMAVERMVRSIREVREVHNRLQVTVPPKSQSHTVQEKYLQAKLAGKLLNSGMKPGQYSVVVRNDVAYLMGAMSYEESVAVRGLTQQTAGIRRFVPLGELFATSEELASGRYPIIDTDAASEGQALYYQPNADTTGLVQRPSNYQLSAPPQTGYVQKWEHPTKAP